MGQVDPRSLLRSRDGSDRATIRGEPHVFLVVLILVHGGSRRPKHQLADVARGVLVRAYAENLSLAKRLAGRAILSADRLDLFTNHDLALNVGKLGFLAAGPLCFRGELRLPGVLSVLRVRRRGGGATH